MKNFVPKHLKTLIKWTNCLTAQTTRALCRKDNLNKPIFVKEIEIVVKILSTNMISRSDGFNGNQTVNEGIMPILRKLFQKLKRRESFPTHTLIPTLCYEQNQLNCFKKRKLRTDIPQGHKCNNSKQSFSKSNPTILITITKE